MKLKNIHYDVWISLGLLAFAGWAWYQTTLFRQAEHTGAYPRILLGIMAALTLIMLIGGIRKSTPEDAKHLGWKTMKMPLVAAVIIIVYEILFLTLGYFIATPVFLIGLFLYLRQRNWKLMIGVTVIYLILVYVIFVMVLRVKLT